MDPAPPGLMSVDPRNKVGVHHAGATTVTTANGTLYWIIGFEFETKATA